VMKKTCVWPASRSEICKRTGPEPQH
jgi:hypothetical protein